MTMAEVVIEAKELTKRFGGFVAVDRVSFQVMAGEVFGFLGPNGAGKTTTIRMLCGLMKPSSGYAKVASFDCARQSEEVKKRIGYMSQRFTLYPDLTVMENLEFYGSIYGVKNLKKRLREVIEVVWLRGLEDKLARDLPIGHRQRLALGCAIVHNPPVLFLDEPTSGVDPEKRRKFWELIYALKSQGTTVLVTTHYMDEAEYCERLALIGSGRILACDTPTAIRKALSSVQVLEIACEPQLIALRVLKPLQNCLFASAFGKAIHVGVVGGEDSIKGLYETLSSNKITVHSTSQAEPSLEDTFIYLVQQAKSS
jgi:ABC-2 type transport system ATP-binding protein